MIFLQWLQLVWRAFLAGMGSRDNETVIHLSPPDMPTTPPVIAPELPPTPPKFPGHIIPWATSVAHWEGALPASNNPGNLKYSSLTASWGAAKGRAAADGGYFCQFSTYEKGFDALCTFLQIGAEGELIISHPEPCTFQAFTAKFAGNPPQGYINGICKDLGITPSTLINTLLS